MPDPVIEFDLDEFGPTPAELMWRSLDPELVSERLRELREQRPYTLKQLRRDRNERNA